MSLAVLPVEKTIGVGHILKYSIASIPTMNLLQLFREKMTKTDYACDDYEEAIRYDH